MGAFCLRRLVIGIDAANIRNGGGVTHLIEILAAFNPVEHGIEKVVIWGGEQTLDRLPDRAWIKRICPPALCRGLFRRALWQRFSLSPAAKGARCDVLFVPGGSYSGDFEPVVTMNQNLLPFEWKELKKFGWTFTALKFLILRHVQTRTFRRAAGVIFLTEYARQVVQKVTGGIYRKSSVIPHGLGRRFQFKPKDQLPIGNYSQTAPYKLLYVSYVWPYKHQWHVVEAVHALRLEGYPITLDLVGGPAYPPSVHRLQSVISQLDPVGNWVRYHGAVPYEELHNIYTNADMGIFASSCETFGMILLETMAAGLPIACSRSGALRESLGDSGLYFDPENRLEIAQTIRDYLLSPALRHEKAQASFRRCQDYSWEQCANRTFALLAEVGREYSRRI